jgi:single-stranded-DNA-specific exonuclease
MKDGINMQTTAGTQANKYLWNIHPVSSCCTEVAKALKISPLLAQILINRGLEESQTANSFLRPKLTDLIRPDQMPGVQAAVARIRCALEAQEKITIYGDYDVDGITGVSILLALFTQLKAEVDYYIPHRIDEGYGLNEEALEQLASAGTKLIITVDCGISAVASAKRAAELGVELIITDHHQPGPELPEAVALVHPLLEADYPNPASAGAMVAFKLAWAVANDLCHGERLTQPLREFMLEATSLAAVGTVADVVDLRGENRILTHYGLKTLAKSKLVGVQALIEGAGVEGKGLDTYDIGFKIGPMLNAAGRMGHARLAVELLASDSAMRSRQIAEYLKEQNTQRQQCGRKIFKEACQQIVASGYHHPDRRSIVLAGENWHRGVLGIVASRIVDKYFRPTIVVNQDSGDSSVAQGSARSIPGFCILDAIRACEEHLVAFGGHEMAAGLTIKADRVSNFVDDFEAFACESLKNRDLQASLAIDAMARLGELPLDVIKQIQWLEPFGQGNPRPMFATKAVHLIATPRRVGAKGDHLQITVSDDTGAMRCIGFGMGKLEKKLQEAEYFHIAYEAQLNTYNGQTNPQLMLLDIQFD